MTMKTLLLGAAAGLTTIGAAQAADLPMLKAEPVEYVKVCSEFGAGFFYIPGTDTCLKISGYVRGDYFFQQPQNLDGANGARVRESDVSQFGGRARIQFDARSSTDYGTLRSFISLDSNFSQSEGAVGDASRNAVNLQFDKAFVQFGGFTVGRAETSFAFYDNLRGDTLFASYFSPQGNADLLQYTAAFGGGFTATLAAEDTADHRTFIEHVQNLGADQLGGPSGYGGRFMPDFVGTLGYGLNDSNGLKAQVMGAVHQVRPDFYTADTEYGYAFGAGVEYSLPFLAGAYINVEGDYADGAVNYLGAGNATFNQNGIAANVGSAVAGAADAYALDNGNLKTSSGFSVTGEVGANITPSLNAILFGSYLNFDAPGFGLFNDDFEAFTVGGNLTYTVVKNLTVAAELSYTSTDVSANNSQGNTDFDNIAGGLRITRSF